MKFELVLQKWNDDKHEFQTVRQTNFGIVESLLNCVDSIIKLFPVNEGYTVSYTHTDGIMPSSVHIRQNDSSPVCKIYITPIENH